MATAMMREAGVQSAVAAAVRLAAGAPSAADGAAHWPTVFQVAMRELVAPLAWARSRRFIQRHADEETTGAWRRAAMATHLRAQRQLSITRDTVRAMASRGVAAVVLKGLPLGERLYGDAFVRSSSDIDLFVAAPQRTMASVALRSLGWMSDDGVPPWHEAWSREGADGREHLELHSSLVCDHLAHLGVAAPAVRQRDVSGEPLHVLDGPFLPAYLAVHLATHQMPPLSWLLDFATLWSSLSRAERDAATTQAKASRVERYLVWASTRAGLLNRVIDGDDAALGPLGFGRDGRRDVHSVVRHLRLAASVRDRLHVLAAFAVPRKARGSVGELVRYSLARARTRFGSLAGERRSYAASELATTPPWTGNGTRPLRVERTEMVSLVREVVYAGGALRVRAPGGSMLPTIPRGALVRIRGVPDRGVEQGNVVLALTADGEPVLHRVIAIDGEVLVTRGDAALADDPPTPRSRVIGVATHVSYLGTERELPRRAPRSLSVAALKLRRRLARAVRRGG
jgi:hypothetical protein